MNGTRTAELKEVEGCPGFMALTHPSLFMGVPRYPRLWDEGLPAALGGTLSVSPPSRSLSAVSWEALSA